MTDVRERIRGSMPALITPMKNGEVDEAAFRKFVSWQIEQGSPRTGSLRHDGRIARPSAMRNTCAWWKFASRKPPGACR